MGAKRITAAALAALDACPEEFTRADFIRNPNVGPVAWRHLKEDGYVVDTGNGTLGGFPIYRKHKR